MARCTEFFELARRIHRIERLLNRLHREVVQGLADGDLDEAFNSRFLVPVGRNIPDHVMLCELRLRQVPAWEIRLASAEGEDGEIRLSH